VGASPASRREPIRVLVTGAAGFLGWHVSVCLTKRETMRVHQVTRKAYADRTALAEAVSGVDAVVHLAGMNRGDPDVVAGTNIRLAADLMAACERAGSRPHILFSSSTQALGDSSYGRSKARAAALLREWAERHEAPFSNLVLPHVFGEMGRPFYNSAVATFCHQLARGEEPTITQDGEVELLHAQEVAREIGDLVRLKAEGGGTRLSEHRLHGRPMRVSAMLARLRGLAEPYQRHIVPDLRDPLDRDLFNTYRACLYPGQYPRPLPVFADHRGRLVEAVKELSGGQVFFSTTGPGITRGNHFHFHKVERFLVVEGEALIRIRRIGHKEVHSFKVGGETPAYVDIPTLHTHNITNTGCSPLLTLFWTHEIFDPAQPDTYPEEV
jgi:UDP-2-acetamido-2,6-beta-L-arabino-hexul-4-ose reductase